MFNQCYVSPIPTGAVRLSCWTGGCKTAPKHNLYFVLQLRRPKAGYWPTMNRLRSFLPSRQERFPIIRMNFKTPSVSFLRWRAAQGTDQFVRR